MFWIYQIFSNLSALAVLVIIALHVICSFFLKNKPLKLDNKSLIVITGGCMGIGLQMVLQLAKQHHSHFLIIDRRKDLFQQTSAQVKEAGGSCQCIYADLGDDSSVSQLIEFLLKRKQSINLFIYNAGIVVPKKTWETTQEQHHLVMKVNYFTPTLMIKKLQPLLIDNHIAVTVSLAAIISGGVDCWSSYSSSKHAIFAYLSSLRQEYKKTNKNITVSMGCPYFINTTMFQGFKTRVDFIFRSLDEKYVAKRLAKQFVQRKEVSYIYQYEALLVRLIEALPTQVLDFFALNLDVSNFEGLRKRQEADKSKKEKKN